ncbi:MAG: hypothetical protein M3162_03720 [Thermoproteota archaeon]|nr:hypothetical protein [Thermoproteota archaeon]
MDIKPYPKLRDLNKILNPPLTLAKVNAILKYLERSKHIIVDLDGNIVWIKQNNLKEDLDLSSVGDFSKEFLEYLDQHKREEKKFTNT